MTRMQLDDDVARRVVVREPIGKHSLLRRAERSFVVSPVERVVDFDSPGRSLPLSNSGHGKPRRSGKIDGPRVNRFAIMTPYINFLEACEAMRVCV